MPKLGRSSRRLVLDIGSSAIRLCELAQTKSGYQLTKYYQREMLIDPSLDEPAKREIRKQTLRTLLKDAKVRSRKVIFAVPGQSVFTRTRPLPPVPEHKVTQIVRYEIQQQIPFALDQIALDYQVLGRTESGGYEVLMAAIKVDVVEKHLDLIQDVKKSVDRVDVAPLAAYNWLKHTGEFGDQGECVALLDIGASTTDIVIERENQFRFTRSLNIGGNDITAAISRNFNVGFAEAEKLKRERGFAPTGDAQRDGKGGEVIGQVLNRLVGEIARSFAYFRSQPGGGPVSRIILTGGTASLRNIVPYLQRQLGIDVRIAQPLAGLAVSANAQEANERPEQASVALGLALRSVQSVPIEINLIPPRILESAKRKEQAFYWALSIVTLALIMASIIPLAAKKNEMVERQIELLKARLEKFDPTIPLNPDKESEAERNATIVENQIDSLDKRIKSLNLAQSKRHFWLDFLKVINDSRPPGVGVWLSSIQTTVIGGPGNTDSGSGAPAPAAAPTLPGGAPGPLGALPGAAPGNASASGERRPGSGFAGLQAALGGAGGTPLGAAARSGAGASGKDTSSTGFPGLQPEITATGSQAAGRPTARRSRSDSGPMSGISAFLGGASGGRVGQAGAFDFENQKSEKPLEPNGLILLGYAETPEAITQFIDRLEETGKFVAVYLDESATKNVPWEQLANANVETATGRMGMPGTGMGGRDRDRGGGLRGLSGLGLGTPRTTYSNPMSSVPTGPTVTAFRLDLQFAGKPIELAEGESLSSGPTGRGGLRGSFSGLGSGRSGGRRGRDDD